MLGCCLVVDWFFYFFALHCIDCMVFVGYQVQRFSSFFFFRLLWFDGSEGFNTPDFFFNQGMDNRFDIVPSVFDENRAVSWDVVYVVILNLEC